MRTAACMVMTTFPDEDSARRVVEKLLDDRLAGCIQTLPVSSSYRWQGKIHHEGETLALIKTTTDRYSSVECLIRQMHPYEVPEVICLPITAGLPDYFAWLRNATEGKG
ncbi:MAG: divalent-cation tolerance protein CutA [Kiritimatiellia bacterium]